MQVNNLAPQKCEEKHQLKLGITLKVAVRFTPLFLIFEEGLGIRGLVYPLPEGLVRLGVHTTYIVTPCQSAGDNMPNTVSLILESLTVAILFTGPIFIIQLF